MLWFRSPLVSFTNNLNVCVSGTFTICPYLSFQASLAAVLLQTLVFYLLKLSNFLKHHLLFSFPYPYMFMYLFPGESCLLMETPFPLRFSSNIVSYMKFSPPSKGRIDIFLPGSLTVFKFFLNWSVANYIDVHMSVSPNQGINSKDTDFISSALPSS